MAKQINWGIIGCGNVTEKKSGPAFNKVENSQLVAVMSRRSEFARDYAYRHKVARWYHQADELINDPEVNAVYIATPPSSHAEYAIQAMQAGKAVYVEKPMAATLEQCEAMNRVSRETNMPLFVAYYRRTLPGFLKVKELIDEERIGRVLYVNMRLVRPATIYESNRIDPPWRVIPEIAGGGLFFDLASHQLDYLDFLFGPVKSVQGLAVNRGLMYQAEDTVGASFIFNNGVLGNGLWSFVTPEGVEEDVMEIVGTHGRIEFSCFQHTPVYLFENDKLTEFPYLNPENIQYNLIRQVVESLQGNGACVSTGESAIRTNKIMHQIVSQYYSR
ncbi:gfo/Idh/MocA family oxidoreductase [Marinilabiliaceae bacterium JC017]|nr:gfo/Idh/MocA family oxidoreductase [Marinilabiliaceae bacterium JC017]